MSETHRAGELAYLDSFGGMLPVTVVSVEQEGSGRIAAGPGQGEITVRLNVTRGGYRKGEEITQKACNVVPRDHTRPRGHINSDYRWVS
jgi:hypothetical protein